jgi:hypothetical protein
MNSGYFGNMNMMVDQEYNSEYSSTVGGRDSSFESDSSLAVMEHYDKLRTENIVDVYEPAFRHRSKLGEQYFGFKNVFGIFDIILGDCHLDYHNYLKNDR